MEVSRDFEGLDFEWFAIDREGRLALFVTAGEGFVPQSVASASDAISALSGTIETPHISTRQVWTDYGAVGLFVYDWVIPNGPYGLVQAPSEPIAAGLQQAILALPVVPKFDVQFGVTEWVGAVDGVAT
jgi:hypothetical protein